MLVEGLGTVPDAEALDSGALDSGALDSGVKRRHKGPCLRGGDGEPLGNYPSPLSARTALSKVARER